MKCPICDGMGTSNTCVNGTFKPCTFCDGTGEVMTDDIKIRCDDCKFQENCVDYGWQECRKFTPKPSEPMTNEEWLRSATFEEMAGAIYEWHSAGYTSGRVGLGLNPITEIVEWLKQPHSEVEK